MSYSTEMPTGALRFRKWWTPVDSVNRDLKFARFTLQQEWSVITHDMDDVPVSETREWRDVSTVEEDS